MSSENRFEFTKDNIDFYFKELAKIYRKKVGKNMRAELILVGGASVLVNYGFRNMTTDVDAVYQTTAAMKDAINSVRDKFGLPNGWINSDFMRTNSYSDKLRQFSVYYKTYSNVVTIRTVAAEYLIAMKLRSGRQYKSDLSDVLGILTEHARRNTFISLNQIMSAVIDLYGAWDELPETSRNFIENAMRDGRFDYLYEQVLIGEHETKTLLINYEQYSQKAMNTKNVDIIAEKLQQKADKATILKDLRQIKSEND